MIENGKLNKRVLIKTKGEVCKINKRVRGGGGGALIRDLRVCAVNFDVDYRSIQNQIKILTVFRSTFFFTCVIEIIFKRL